MGLGHLLCHLQLQAPLVSWPENFASTDMQQTSTSLQLRFLGPVRTGTAAGTRDNVVGSSGRCSPAQRFLAGEGRGTACFCRQGAGTGAFLRRRSGRNLSLASGGSSCRSSFPAASAVPAPLSALFGPLETGLRQASLCATEGSVAAPAGAKLSVPGLKGKPLPDRNVK